MTAVAPTNSFPAMSSTLTTSIHPHCSLLRALFVVPGSLSTNMGRRSMTVRVLVGNQDVSPPMSMSDAEEDDDDVDNWDRGEMNSDGSLIITKTTNTAISKHKKGTVKQATAVLSLAGGGRGGITPIGPFCGQCTHPPHPPSPRACIRRRSYSQKGDE